MSDKDNSSGTTAYEGVPGILFVGAHIQNKHTPEQLLHDWYISHYNDLLSLPNNSNLSLRYRNLDPAANVYADPNQPARASMSALEVRHAIANFTWKYLGVNKVNDLNWLLSDEFRGLPLTSPLLPKRPDGSDGGAFDVWFAALRVYEKVKQEVKRPAAAGRGKWLVTVQVDDLGQDVVGEVRKVYGEREECRSVMICRVTEGLSEFPEVGPFPEGLVVMEFDGECAPKKEDLGVAEKVVRVDLWECFVEVGDASLEL